MMGIVFITLADDIIVGGSWVDTQADAGRR